MNRIVCRVEDKLYERVRIEAIHQRKTVNQLCTEALTSYLDFLREKRIEPKKGDAA